MGYAQIIISRNFCISRLWYGLWWLYRGLGMIMIIWWIATQGSDSNRNVWYYCLYSIISLESHPQRPKHLSNLTNLSWDHPGKWYTLSCLTVHFCRTYISHPSLLLAHNGWFQFISLSWYWKSIPTFIRENTFMSGKYVFLAMLWSLRLWAI